MHRAKEWVTERASLTLRLVECVQSVQLTEGRVERFFLFVRRSQKVHLQLPTYLPTYLPRPNLTYMRLLFRRPPRHPSRNPIRGMMTR